MQISKKLFDLETESAFEVLTKVNKLKSKGKNVINLSIGQPDFPTPNNIVEAGIKALKDGHHGYTHSNGMPKLREAVSEDIFKSYNVEINPENIIISLSHRGNMTNRKVPNIQSNGSHYGFSNDIFELITSIDEK